MDVVVLTDKRYLNAASKDDPNKDYFDNLLTEDMMVLDALKKCGLRVDRRAWCDEAMDWSITKSALFRTTWDYFDRWSEFSPWLHRVQSQTHLFNAASIVHWNLDKHYLKDLKKLGVNVVPTEFVKKGGSTPLNTLSSRLGWTDVVIKPAIAGAAIDTYRVTIKGNEHICSPDAQPFTNCESLWQSLVAQQDMLVQPFLPQVIEAGEKSLIWLDGHVTHGVLKKAKTGDFRVQDDHGGTVHSFNVKSEDETLARDIMSKCIQHCRSRGWDTPIYARVDLMRDNEGQWLLSELEMVEPELWFRFNPPAAQILARAIQKRLASLS